MPVSTLSCHRAQPHRALVYPLLGAWNLLLLAMALLAATLPFLDLTSNAAPERLRRGAPAEPAVRPRSGGFALVLGDRHLLLLALLAVLLNCVNTTGEFILTELVIRHADQRIVLQPTLDKGNLIAAFYGDYYFAVNAVSVVFQLLLVARVFRWIGVHGAILLLPMIALAGYGLVVFVPVFSIIWAVKVLENGIDYSIMNTARHALYLPLPARHQFEGKTAIDTFFWRLGDLVQAGLIYAGLNWFGFEIHHFAIANMVLASVWICVAVRIGKRYAGAAPRPRAVKWRPLLVGAGSTVFAVVAFAVPRGVRAAEEPLFGEQEPLTAELQFDGRELCRTTVRDGGCSDVPAVLAYTDVAGAAHRIDVQLQPRGKWRAETGHCTLPPLFVSFDGGATAGTVFEGLNVNVLPLTTHCRDSSSYEQFLLKEYLAYRIYNVLTEKSLRVRLARITYRDTGRAGRTVERYAFFTEHFESFAARQDAELWKTRDFDRLAADPRELATLDLFEYLIGNTDWSSVRGHNVAHVRSGAGTVTAVPYDFDFSGLVDAVYAGPPPELPIRSVTQRLFRGYCRPGFDWREVFEYFQMQRDSIDSLVEEVPGLSVQNRRKASAYVDGFFDAVGAHDRDEINASCRRAAAARN